MELTKTIPYSLRPLFTLLLTTTSLLIAGCGVEGDSQVLSDEALLVGEPDTSAVLFETDRVMEVAIQMDPAQYDVLRSEGRSAADVFSGCAVDYDYSLFPASVTIDGEPIDNVSIRKKGFLGSLSRTRPSLKINFSDLVPGRTFYSMKRMTLNNDRQDTGHASQCVTYELFRAAGLVAPRCSTARVTMNGEDLGFYSHVESIKKPFLRRNFSNAEGNLYESQGGDFGRYVSQQLELKTNEEKNDRSDLEFATAILSASDANLESMLSEIINIDEFISYWAMEIITGHWDGATGSANNHYIYHNPDDGRFHYIPWGADGAMITGTSPLTPLSGQLYRFTLIPSRLFVIPALRERLDTRLEEFLATVWNEDQLQARVEQIRVMTQISEAENTGIREFIDSNRERIAQAIAVETAQDTDSILPDSPNVCDEFRSTIIAEFGSAGVFIELTSADGEVTRFDGLVDTSAGIVSGSVELSILTEVGGALRVLTISIDEAEFKVGEIPLHGLVTNAILLKETANGFQPIGFGGTGTISLGNPDAEGQPTSGRLEGVFYVFDD